MATFDSIKHSNLYEIFDIWDTNSNEFNEPINYVTNTLCPNIMNKRNCAFLYLTNCSMPNILTNLRGNNVNEIIFSKTAYFNKANINGILINEKYLIYYNKIILKTDIFYDYDRILYPTQTTQGSYNLPDARDILFGFGFIFRSNYYYRKLVNNKIKELKKIFYNKIKYNEECTTLHIRRGDRTITQTNDMIAYCNSIVRLKNDKCFVKFVNETIECGLLENLGCFRNKPFGSLKLTDYLSRASILSNTTKNIYILTDDGTWLIDQINQLQQTDKTWNIYYISSDRDSRRHNSKTATENGVDFIASVAMAQKCSNFVGHWGSSVATFIYKSMCFQHNDKDGNIVFGKCPKTYNIGGHQTEQVPLITNTFPILTLNNEFIELN